MGAEPSILPVSMWLFCSSSQPWAVSPSGDSSFSPGCLWTALGPAQLLASELLLYWTTRGSHDSALCLHCSGTRMGPAATSPSSGLLLQIPSTFLWTFCHPGWLKQALSSCRQLGGPSSPTVLHAFFLYKDHQGG